MSRVNCLPALRRFLAPVALLALWLPGPAAAAAAEGEDGIEPTGPATALQEPVHHEDIDQPQLTVPERLR